MAAFFVALACLAWVRGLSRDSKPWLAVAVLAYLLAVFSKEYAVTAAALALPLYVFVRRPRAADRLARGAAAWCWCWARGCCRSAIPCWASCSTTPPRPMPASSTR
jgi:hypothetical protein